MTERSRKTHQIVTRFPCGGKLVVHCSHVKNASLAAGESDIDVIFVPEVYCVRRYVPYKGCPWLHLMWKFNEGITRRQQQGVVDANADGGRMLESKVFHGEGNDTCVFNTQVGSGLVVWRGKVFQDPHFGCVAYKGPEKFDCFDDVKTWHGGIIAFFRRLFGRGKKEVR